MLQFKITFQIVMLLAFACPFAISTKCKYDDITPHHSYCKERNPKCEMFDTGLNASMIDIILRKHNDNRAHVALGKETKAGGMPTASNMLKVTWDAELAKIAQRHVEQCEERHDCPECRETFAFDVGQNLYYHTSNINQTTEEAISKAISMWYEVVSTFDKSMVSEYKDGPWRTFTQLIWATTKKIGCGFVNYKKDGWYNQIFACNYGPRGNLRKSPVYEEGEIQASCSTNSSRDGLCKEIPDEDERLNPALKNYAQEKTEEYDELLARDPKFWSLFEVHSISRIETKPPGLY